MCQWQCIGRAEDCLEASDSCVAELDGEILMAHVVLDVCSLFIDAGAEDRRMFCGRNRNVNPALSPVMDIA